MEILEKPQHLLGAPATPEEEKAAEIICEEVKTLGLRAPNKEFDVLTYCR